MKFKFKPNIYHDGADGINWSGSDEDFEFESTHSHKLFEEGDKDRLLWFMNFCFVYRRPVPTWATKAFRAAYLKGVRFEIASWDEVFGRPLKKGKQLAAERRKAAIAERVLELVLRARHEEKPKKPINKELFESIGKKLGVGGTVAAEIYYQAHKKYLEQSPVN
jgi:hypothetical protein